MAAVKYPLDRFRRSILSDPDLSILCGAGISMIPPSNLPSGDRLRDQCVRLLLSDHRSRKLLGRIMRSPAYQALLPEGVLQDIGSFASSSLDQSMSSLLLGVQPNAVHEHLALNYRRLFTTNFDLCLEDAGARAVSHLHGTISAPETLQNRIFRLGRTAHAEFVKFKSWIRGKGLLILGYSMRDRDIIEAIEASPPAKIFYLSRGGELPPPLRDTLIPVIYARGVAEELFGVSSTGVRPRRRAHRPRLRKPALGRRVPALLHLLYRAGFYDAADRIMRSYLPHLRGRGKYKAICQLMEALRVSGEYDAAARWCDYVMDSRFAARPENAEILSSAYVVRGLCDYDRGRKNYGEISRWFREALRLTRAFESLQRDDSQKAAIQIWKARIHNNLGLVATAQNDYPRAIDHFDRSLRIKERFHEETGIAQTHANLAMIYLSSSDFGDATRHLKLVVRLMRKSPSKYICRETILQALRLFHSMTSIPPALQKATLPTPAGSKFWARLASHLKVKWYASAGFIKELANLNAILLEIGSR
jgi:tetratricopeptide (TPR) repeat protein